MPFIIASWELLQIIAKQIGSKDGLNLYLIQSNGYH
jgi:hypothetical protein